MKQYWTHKLIITIAMLFSVGYGYAQTRSSFYKPNAWFVGADAGANVFFGDIKYWDYMPNTKYGELTYAYGVRFGKQLSPRVLVKADAHYSTHSGTKRTSSLLRTFEAVSYDATLSLQLNIMEMMHSRPKQQKLSIWGELGVGYMQWQSLLYNYQTGDTLNNLNWKTKEYENALVFPVGMNIKYYLSPKISLDAYSSLRIVNSDLLDAKPGGIKFDYYWYNALAVNYHIGSSSKSSSDKKEKYSRQSSTSGFYSDDSWFGGFDFGANIFYGDIKYWDYVPNTKYGELSYGYGLRFGKQFSPRVMLKADFHKAELSGTKRTPSLLRKFDAKTFDFSLSVQLNLMEFLHSTPEQRRLSLWGELGIGYINWQAILYNYRTGDTINNLLWNTKEYNAALMIPLGFNIKYYLNDRFSLDAYSSLRVVNSDEVDGKIGGIKFDYYWYAALGINYHFSIFGSGGGASSKELILLDYYALYPKEDTLKKKEVVVKDTSLNNPFYVDLWVPEEANNKAFSMLVKIIKKDKTANGYFHLSLPSGFYPIPPEMPEVKYTRIAYNYDFDFYIPEDQDTLKIPIGINISEREDGIYPIFLEGEAMNEIGELFPIKAAQYVKIGPDNYNNTQEDFYINPDNVSTIKREAAGSKTYRIQILACRKPSALVDEFLKKHQITQEVYLYEAGGWWRYSIYTMSSMQSAKEKLQFVRNKNGVSKAFIVAFDNGERSVPGGQPAYAKGISSSRVSSYTPTRKSIQQKEQASVTTRINLDPEIDVAENKEEIKEAKASPDESFERIVENKGVSVYRIEIAVKPTAPIPLRQLQNWVANEKISEWTYKNNYRYTIGRFENEQVARAFLKYVRLQFSLPDAHLVITKGDRWLKVHR